MQVVGVQRAERFSPNNVDNDLAILRAVVEPLGGEIVSEEAESLPGVLASVGWVFSMARTERALRLLAEAERRGARVINPAEGVRQCARDRLERLAREVSVPVPPSEGADGYWLKRADAAAQSRGDVVFCADRATLEQAVEAFRRRGIGCYIVQAHQPGDLVKFYGVLGTGFFRLFYPGDDGQSKFGDEQLNGRPHHYDFSVASLQSSAERLAAAARCPVYGGDAVVSASGSFALIDFNDWPSFSRCRMEAARAVRLLAQEIAP